MRVAIIGAGFSGIGMACGLLRAGVTDFVLLERAREVGGTWRDNVYPGAACDIPADLYSFSFAPNPDWSHRYPRQEELLHYLRDVADRFGVTPHIRFGTEVESGEWDAAAAVWRIATNAASWTADVLVSASGPFIDPAWPAIPGVETFPGPRLHTARWDPALDVAGKTIAVLGTGASAIQLVPELRPRGAWVIVLQRTAPWVIPRHDPPTSDRRRRAFRRRPWRQRLARALVFAGAEARFPGFATPVIGRVAEAVYRRSLRRQITDPTLREQVMPRFRLGCKRVLISSDWYPALASPEVRLVTEPVLRIDGAYLVTAAGARHRADVLVAATGFNVTAQPIATRIRSRGGTLAEHWRPHASALRGTTVAGFPNLFLLVGPNTALAHNSMVYVIESQIRYVLAALAALEARRARTIETDPVAQRHYADRLDRALTRSVWQTGGCVSYYQDAGGANPTIWPHAAATFARTVRRFDPAEYLWE
ncbi:NAD(P)/FAD-dependent oxidoreductase [Pseudolysinimonas kribbensis]|uniref:flavin-containing monooxygenase n=1 Tax=Pseudolysinimonas kribbensis TaxID=433641 RepID=UPI0031DA4590